MRMWDVNVALQSIYDGLLSGKVERCGHVRA